MAYVYYVLPISIALAILFYFILPNELEEDAEEPEEQADDADEVILERASEEDTDVTH